MITINKIISPDNQVIGIEMLIDNEAYFIATDQVKFKGIRLGRFPRYADSEGRLTEFVREEVCSIPH